jgi:hypothetical protein
MTQEGKSQGGEGWLAPARVECHSILGGGKLPFPASRFSILFFTSDFELFYQGLLPDTFVGRFTAK